MTESDAAKAARLVSKLDARGRLSDDEIRWLNEHRSILEREIAVTNEKLALLDPETFGRPAQPASDLTKH
jgi:hypothetical protein